MRKRKKIVAIGALVALLGGGASLATTAGAADHLDAPLVQADGRTDINDLYIFTSPTNPDNTVMIMTVNPGAGVISGTEFDSDAYYQFYLDKDGDARQDQTFTVGFDTEPDGSQTAFVHDTNGGLKPGRIDRGAVGTTVELSNGGMLATGVYDDPFFFDLVGFQNGFDFDGTDFFAGLDVSAIVLEVPTSEIGANGDAISMFAATYDRTDGKPIDRMGRPAINTVLLPTSEKDAFNRVAPHRQPALFTDEVVDTLLALGNDQARAEAIASVLLPDVNTFQLGSTDGFLNGRQLADDVIDAELALLSNEAVTTDSVDSNDRSFLDEFPYLAAAHAGNGEA